MQVSQRSEKWSVGKVKHRHSGISGQEQHPNFAVSKADLSYNKLGSGNKQ